MMKKEKFLLAILFSLILISFIRLSLAETNPGDTSQVIGKEFNISPENIPANPEDIQNQFLKQRWSDMISNSTYIGPVHKFFVAHPLIFQIIFAHAYEFSWEFLFVIIFWLLFLTSSSKIIQSTEIVKGGISLLMGLVLAVIIAQTRILNYLAKALSDFLFAQESWWIRLIVGIVVFAAVIILYYLAGMISKQIKANKKKQLEKEQKQGVKELKELSTGIKEVKRL
jgi:predicted membrane protein